MRDGELHEQEDQGMCSTKYSFVVVVEVVAVSW